MTRPLFSIGDAVASEIAGRPFEAIVLDKCRMGWPGRLHLLVMLLGWDEPQWWPASWCTAPGNERNGK